MYIDILGYSVDFGHMEAMELLHSTKYPDKLIGYIVLGSLVNEKSEMIRLVNQALLSDLTSKRECFQTLALAFIANCGNIETAETLANNVSKLLMNKSASRYIVKKASLCLLHMFRKNPEAVQQESWDERLSALLQNRDGGVLTCVMSLLHAFANSNPPAYVSMIPIVCKMVKSVVLEKAVTGDYMYDHIPAPWLVVKVFQFLQHYTDFESDEALSDIMQVLRKIINTETKHFLTVDPASHTVKRHNAMLAVLFEAIHLAVALRIELELIQRCIQHVRYFLTINDPDIRYLSLEVMQRLCPLDPSTTGDDEVFVGQVERMLVHPDISLRRRAMDVLFELCSEKNSSVVVGKLVNYLDQAEYEIKEELVLKIAILAEKYPSSMEWYIDVILRLLQCAGDATPQEIWFRTVQIVSTNPPMQSYAAATAAVMLRQINLPDSAVRMCSYLVGEYHSQVNPAEMPASEIVEKLGMHLEHTKPATKSIILSALAKIGASTPDTSNAVNELLTKYSTFIAEDAQERSCEFLSLLTNSISDAKTTLAPLPPFPERQSILLKDLKKKVQESGVVERASRHLEGVKDEKEDEEGNEGNEEAGGGAPSQMQFAAASEAASAVGGYSSEQPAPTAVAAGEEDDDMIDLSDFGVSTKPVAVASSSAAGAANSAVVDTSSFDPAALLENLMTTPAQQSSSSSVPGQPMGAAIAAALPPPEANQQLELFHNALMCNVEGKLYEDANLCITCHHEYQKHEGRMLLTWTNKTGVMGGAPPQTLMSVSGTIESTAELTIQAEPVPTTINPSASAPQRIMIAHNQPVAKAPLLTLSYTVGVTTHRALVKIPAVGIKFFQPVTPPKEVFVSQWQSVPANSPMTATDTFFFMNAPLNPQSFQQVVAFLQGPAKMQPLPGYDDTPQTLCFAAGVCCGSAPQPMPLMFKMQMSPIDGKLILTVKGCTPQVAEVTKKFVIEMLKKM
eukprot:MONOS_4830.1-p1 / transcript=MONOS_4830.1 / gene=MONOS_4830 / organism=Monocercomonoides_exilis_PA203 / gene_product= Adaptor protein complex 2 (AP-2), alpha subunit C / transcript_product= Adaptor protein complex 2 (AP-2), alpha subunit C / location=Mono_scaffold00134:62235-65345(+) / protein_length=962 / sequence_SO=supercontig / SO=protein_coding / is_pseudo=false